ncbi:MAG: hypothetical protein JWN95_1751 [Frankiales bacterium]|nr:hypothetical protein [Frankiales bacterium]
MTLTDLTVLVGALVVSAGLAWFFFGTKRPTQHAIRNGQTQPVTVVVPSCVAGVVRCESVATVDARPSSGSERCACSSRALDSGH